MDLKMDDGIQFGLGVFETIALEQGKPVFLQEHLERMQAAADFFGWGALTERGITKEEILNWLKQQSEDEKTADRCRHGALKLMVSEKNQLCTLRDTPYTSAQYEKGFCMDFSQVRRNETSPLVYHKTMNYGDCILEKRAATKDGMNERIFLNTKGEIAEGCVSNIFVVRKGEVLTPEYACGLLPGIMRAFVMRTVPVTETRLYPEDLADCEECFVTNSLMGIMPVRRLGDYTFTSTEKAGYLRKQYSICTAEQMR